MRAIGFDLDGTLVDSKPSIVFAFERVFERIGKQAPSATIIRSKVGLPMDRVLEELGFARREHDHVRAIYVEQLLTHMREHLRAFRGAVSTVQALRTRGHRVALVTARGRDTLFDCLEFAGISHSLFDVIIGRQDTQEHKPHPAPVLLACSQIGCAPENFVYVGDAELDIDCAEAAGSFSIHAEYGADAPLPIAQRTRYLGAIDSLEALAAKL